MAASTGSTFVLVTGASQGYGRALALAFAKVLGTATISLTARSASKLGTTKSLVEKVNPAATVKIIEADLSIHEGITKVQEAAVEEIKAGGFTDGYFASNAGTIGPLHVLEQVPSVTSPAELAGHWNVNITAHMVLTGALAGAFRAHLSGRGTVLNTSSLAAVQAMATWGVYCTHKTARDMVLAVAAVEAKGLKGEDKDKVVFLNWGPGPMDGDMHATIRGSDSVDPGVKSWAVEAKASGGLVPMASSAARGVALVTTPAGQALWESGAHVDIFEEKVQALATAEQVDEAALLA